MFLFELTEKYKNMKITILVYLGYFFKVYTCNLRSDGKFLNDLRHFFIELMLKENCNVKTS